MKFFDLIITPFETISQAMEKMTKNHKGLLLVCDSDYHLIGVLSDGDIRRGLIDEISLKTPVNKIMNTSPTTAKDPEEAKKIVLRKGYVVVPIVDRNGFLKSAAVLEGENILIIEREDYIEKEKIDEMPALAIIPARGGSKRIPKKNIQKVGGEPLIYWSILQAKSSKHIKKIILSTDDLEIKEVAEKYGIEVPWMRPKELAEDKTPTLEVVLHSLNMVKDELNKFKIGVLLEPTAPLRIPSQIDNGIEKLYFSDADSIISVYEVPHIFNPEELVTIENGLLKPYKEDKTMDTRNLRGKQTPVFAQSGNFYAFKIESILKYKSLYGEKCLSFIIDKEYFLDIDTKEDLEIADFKIHKILKKHWEEFNK